MPLSVLKDIQKIYAGLNAHDIRATAARDVNVGLMATSGSVYRKMQDFLAPPSMGTAAREQVLRSVHPVEEAPRRFDFVLCEPGIAVPPNGYLFEPPGPDSLIPLIVGENQSIETAIAKTFPVFRSAVAGKIINRIARENAFFSLVTALPNVIPSMLELPWTVGEFATDTAFLTMNQIRMALMLAAAHGRPVGYMEQKAEIAGIVASAFGWRAIAREMVGKIPMGGGLIPKAAVAFGGTYVVGLSLDKVNRTGTGLSRQERRDAYADAFVKGKDTVRQLAPDLLQNKGTPVAR